jgi:hypothetical protein
MAGPQDYMFGQGPSYTAPVINWFGNQPGGGTGYRPPNGVNPPAPAAGTQQGPTQWGASLAAALRQFLNPGQAQPPAAPPAIPQQAAMPGPGMAGLPGTPGVNAMPFNPASGGMGLPMGVPPIRPQPGPQQQPQFTGSLY